VAAISTVSAATKLAYIAITVKVVVVVADNDIAYSMAASIDSNRTVASATNTVLDHITSPNSVSEANITAKTAEVITAIIVNTKAVVDKYSVSVDRKMAIGFVKAAEIDSNLFNTHSHVRMG